MSESNGGEGASTDGESPPGGDRASDPERTDADGRTVAVRVVGEGTTEVRLDADATCADLLRAVDLSPHTATALVDGRPIPSDARVPDGEVRVLRLVKGG